jgi:hypothetical protein
VRLTSLALAASALILSAGAAFAAGDQDFTLRNKTGYQIDNVYLSKPNQDSWGSDVMGRGNVLEDDASTDITFHDSARGCHWDLKVMYHDKDTASWTNLNLCEISTVTLHYDRKSGVTRASTE